MKISVVIILNFKSMVRGIMKLVYYGFAGFCDFGVSKLKQNFVAQKYRNDMRGAHLGPGNPIMLLTLWPDDAFTSYS